jgi:hypothetical protein
MNQATQKLLIGAAVSIGVALGGAALAMAFDHSSRLAVEETRSVITEKSLDQIQEKLDAILERLPR